MPNNCSVASVMKVEVRPYLKPDGWKTKYWGVYVDEALLGITVYKKGAVAISTLLDELQQQNIRHSFVNPVAIGGKENPEKLGMGNF